MSDIVIVLHGIFRTYRSMNGLANELTRHHYNVLNLGYPSTKYPLEKLVDYIHPKITQFINNKEEKIHFVGYSMGGLLIRAYLHKHRPHNLGRIVMIGTPNNGSEVADFIKDWKIYKALYGPAGQQLVTNQSAFKYHLGHVDYELGIIAGNRPIDIISSKIIGKPNDGKVSIESTRLEGTQDHIIVPCNHTFFPSHKQSWQHVLSFLKNGTFK